jgi:RND family efflux transporter MFP subunit
MKTLVALAGMGSTMGMIWQAGASGDPLSKLPCLFLPGKSEAKSAGAKPGPSVVAEGRVVAYPGAEVLVSSEVSGLIVALPVVEKMAVRRGDLIAELRADDLRAERAEAVARIAEADADIKFYEREVRREEALFARQSGTARDLDANRRALATAIARRDAAKATRDRLDARIDKTRIVAPIDGVITARHADAGETIETGTRLVTIVDLSRLRIEAEVDEFDAARVVEGAPVAIRAEGYASPWQGTIEEVPDEVVARRLRPEDPGRPIDARVLPAKVAFSEKTPLKLGQRVEVTVGPLPGYDRGF